MRIDYDKVAMEAVQSRGTRPAQAELDALEAAGKAAMEAYEADAADLDALIEQLGLRG